MKYTRRYLHPQAGIFKGAFMLDMPQHPFSVQGQPYFLKKPAHNLESCVDAQEKTAFTEVVPAPFCPDGFIVPGHHVNPWAITKQGAVGEWIKGAVIRVIGIADIGIQREVYADWNDAIYFERDFIAQVELF